MKLLDEEARENAPQKLSVRRNINGAKHFYHNGASTPAHTISIRRIWCSSIQILYWQNWWRFTPCSPVQWQMFNTRRTVSIIHEHDGEMSRTVPNSLFILKSEQVSRRIVVVCKIFLKWPLQDTVLSVLVTMPQVNASIANPRLRAKLRQFCAYHLQQSFLK